MEAATKVLASVQRLVAPALKLPESLKTFPVPPAV
jgi:hypothetical protein